MSPAEAHMSLIFKKVYGRVLQIFMGIEAKEAL